MKKNHILLFCLLTLSFCFEATAQEYCGNVRKVSITPTKLRVAVDLTGSVAFGLGSSNIELNFNTNGLSNPTFISSPIGPPFYQQTTVTNPLADVTSINIEYSIGLCNSDFHFEIGTTDTEIAVIEFDILNTTETSGISWIYNGATASTGTVVYLCDEVVQLSSQGDNTSCLIGLDALLPIDLKDFEVKAVNNQDAHLDWSTTMEVNGSHFEIERSYDAKSWEHIATVNAAGNSDREIEYDYLDKNVAKSISILQKAYYRLKMVDLDGSYKYSEVRTAQFEAKDTKVQVFPNPTFSNITVVLDPLLELENGSIEIREMTGKLIGKIDLDSNHNTRIPIELKQFGAQAGVYWLKISDGSDLISNQRIIVVD